LGALFTKQAGWQIVVASYYVFVDFCLVVQYFWYTYFKPRIDGGSLHSAGSSELGDADSDIINTLSPINSGFSDGVPEISDADTSEITKPPQTEPRDTPQFSEVHYEKNKLTPSVSSKHADRLGAGWLASPSPRTLLHVATLSSLASRANAAPIPFPSDHYQHGIHLLRVDTPLEIIGTILSWCSTFLYLGSRLPQLYHNWTRKSTAGLSPLLFFAAFCGNSFYASSLLTNPNAWDDYGPHGCNGWVDQDGSQRWAWVARAAPFFLGAAGVLGLDGMMGVQFLLYGDTEAKIVKVRDKDGYSHWERVNGWMRGWIPSVSGKERVVDLAESQRLLGESRELSRSRSRSYHDYGTHG